MRDIWKNIGQNLLIVLAYFAVYLGLAWRESGGDMFVMLFTTGTALFHAFVLLILAIYFDRKNSYFGLLGILLGLGISLMLIKNVLP